MTVWAVSASQFLSDRRDALIALVPIAERTRMLRWKPQAYDDWELIEATLCQSIVVSPFETMVEGGPWFPVAAYDFRFETYWGKSFVGLAGDPKGAALVCLDAWGRPFDTCVLARLMLKAGSWGRHGFRLMRHSSLSWRVGMGTLLC